MARDRQGPRLGDTREIKIDDLVSTQQAGWADSTVNCGVGEPEGQAHSGEGDPPVDQGGAESCLTPHLLLPSPTSLVPTAIR